MTLDTGCVLICDSCGLELSGRRNTIYRDASEGGWQHANKDDDICPNCVAGGTTLCEHRWIDTYEFGGHYPDGSKCVLCGVEGGRRF